MSGEHPIFERLDRLKTDLAMRFMRAARAEDIALRDELLGKIDTVEKTEQIAREFYHPA